MTWWVLDGWADFWTWVGLLLAFGAWLVGAVARFPRAWTQIGAGSGSHRDAEAALSRSRRRVSECSDWFTFLGLLVAIVSFGFVVAS